MTPTTIWSLAPAVLFMARRGTGSNLEAKAGSSSLSYVAFTAAQTMQPVYRRQLRATLNPIVPCPRP